MSTRTGRGIMVTLLLVTGCGSEYAARDNQGGGTTGNAGAAGTGAGGDGSDGTGTAGGGWAGASGGAASSAGAGGGSGTGETAGGGGVAGTTWLTPPPFPPALAPPAGATVKLHAHAVGAQIYTCTASGATSADGGAGVDGGATTYAWVLKAPDAKLYDSNDAQIGTHGAGPSWTWSDGSVANGAKVAELNAPAADAISWLLLRVTSTTGAGVLSDATYVQRLNTAGGKAPADGCDATTVGTDARSGYSADYYFYSGGGASAWLTAPEVPSAIAVPTDVRLAVHDRASGMQIYNCAASAGAGGTPTYAWTFKAPDALLVDMNFTPVALHGAGPSWTASDGSVVVAPEIARADAPRADAIPWLLLKELSTSGPGVFSDVAFVQRINTSGGVAPTTGCDASTVNTLVRVPYAADYYFYVTKT
ncbi:MAG TPA: DUF3455 domain-containing protein [Polyangia bacterium]